MYKAQRINQTEASPSVKVLEKMLNYLSEVGMGAIFLGIVLSVIVVVNVFVIDYSVFTLIPVVSLLIGCIPAIGMINDSVSKRDKEHKELCKLSNETRMLNR
jgi:hypothetical protein